MGRETMCLSTPPPTTATTTVNPVPPPPPAPPTSLAPGFRFHPTDEELVIYYLKRKVSGKSFRFDAISEVDIYRSEPWDLAGHSLCFHFISLYFHLSVLKFEIFVVLFLWVFFLVFQVLYLNGVSGFFSMMFLFF